MGQWEGLVKSGTMGRASQQWGNGFSLDRAGLTFYGSLWLYAKEFPKNVWGLSNPKSKRLPYFYYIYYIYYYIYSQKGLELHSHNKDQRTSIKGTSDLTKVAIIHKSPSMYKLKSPRDKRPVLAWTSPPVTSLG